MRSERFIGKLTFYDTYQLNMVVVSADIQYKIQ